MRGQHRRLLRRLAIATVTTTIGLVSTTLSLAQERVANDPSGIRFEAPPGAAQQPALPPPTEPLFALQGFFSFDWLSLTAKDSFDAIIGSSSVTSLGGGAQVTHRSGIVGRVQASYSSDNGERAFIFNNDVIPLGIPTTIKMTPIDVSAGYRFFVRRSDQTSWFHRVAPYGGGGVGVLRYKETADFANEGDDVDERFTSYNAFGGLEVSVWRFIGARVEVHSRWVPDAIGDAGVSEAFDETDLGGVGVRIHVTVGR